MTLHNNPEFNTPEMLAAMKAHGMTVDAPSQVADAFRLGWMAAQPGWQASRCAECECENGGAECNWIKFPLDMMEKHGLPTSRTIETE
jgi:hypothetical protein